jgi:hypothetical protein
MDAPENLIVPVPLLLPVQELLILPEHPWFIVEFLVVKQ